jgi:hypothetical protein
MIWRLREIAKKEREKEKRISYEKISINSE